MQVRKLMAGRQESGWKFGDLFLVKDSLAVMLEAAGLMEDALREYFELEACFLEVPMHSGALSVHAFGARTIACSIASPAAQPHAGSGTVANWLVPVSSAASS